MPTSAEIRARARAGLKGHWWNAVGVVFLFMLISGVLNLLPLIGIVLTILIAGPLTYGLNAYFLMRIRGQPASVSNLFGGFSRFGGAFLLYLLIAIFVFLWSLLLVIPGIIAGLRYSMAYFILADEPELGAMEAIRRSKQLMIGHKGRLFVLYLTFIGWSLLAALTCGIGYLWLAPYILAAKAAFFEDLQLSVRQSAVQD